ncbi:MAG: Asp-tRNA(Asn)/Glu-tRNA(Gln) amidotransferase subunit GatC [Bacilli bacterium]|nr:Asp-tRNA(Asn)/Glu-tRNA(Gln) amidotransferase subunit GatC [Bacilli bacterium]
MIIMKPVTKEILKESANKLMFDMSDEQYSALLEEFDTITKQMELISEIPNVDEITPMVFPFDVTNDYLREDVAQESLKRDDALKNAKDVVDGQIRLPKVVG